MAKKATTKHQSKKNVAKEEAKPITQTKPSSQSTVKESKALSSISKVSMTLNQATMLQTVLAKKGRRQRFLDHKIAQAKSNS